MNNHLNEDQITEWVIGTNKEFILRHIEICPVCSAQAGELRSALAGFRNAIHDTAQRDERFWRTQQLAFRERASAREWYPLHWAWVVVMVMVLIAAIFLTRTPNPSRNYPSEDADYALLQAVQGDLGRGVPQALAPAVLIAEERNEILTNHLPATPTTPKK